MQSAETWETAVCQPRRKLSRKKSKFSNAYKPNIWQKRKSNKNAEVIGSGHTSNKRQDVRNNESFNMHTVNNSAQANGKHVETTVSFIRNKKA